MIAIRKHYGADDVVTCPKCGTGRMRVGRRTPDFQGDPAHEVQSLRCPSCGDEMSRTVDAQGDRAN